MSVKIKIWDIIRYIIEVSALSDKLTAAAGSKKSEVLISAVRSITLRRSRKRNKYFEIDTPIRKLVQ